MFCSCFNPPSPHPSQLGFSAYLHCKSYWEKWKPVKVWISRYQVFVVSSWLCLATCSECQKTPTAQQSEWLWPYCTCSVDDITHHKVFVCDVTCYTSYHGHSWVSPPPADDEPPVLLKTVLCFCRVALPVPLPPSLRSQPLSTCILTCALFLSPTRCCFFRRHRKKRTPPT